MELPVSLEAKISTLADQYIAQHDNLLTRAIRSRTTRNEILSRIISLAKDFSKNVKTAIADASAESPPDASPYFIAAYSFREARKSSGQLGETSVALLLWRLEMDWQRKGDWRSKKVSRRSNACILQIWNLSSGYGTSLPRLAILFVFTWLGTSFVVLVEQVSCTKLAVLLSDIPMFFVRWLYTVFSATIGVGNVDTSNVCSPLVFFILGFNSLVGLLLVSSIVALVAVRVLVSER